MGKLTRRFMQLEKRKKGKLLLTSGMLLLVVSAVMMVLFNTAISSALFALSFIFNIFGLYIILWVRDGGKGKNDKR